MKALLNFLQNKYSKLLFIAVVAVFIQPINASDVKSCDYRVFNIKTAEKIQAIELLTQIADSCDFSIVVKDNFAKTTLDKDLYGINIKNLSLDDIFEVIISDNDLFYEYNRNFLRISALKTKTFRVDYITSVRQGTATLNASLEGATGGDTTSASSSTNTVTSNDTFDFWTTMNTEIISILNTGSDSYMAQAPIINSNAGLVTVTGTKKQLDRIEKYLNVLKDRLHKQVLIDVSILTVNLSKTKKTGINWSQFDLSLNHTSSFNNTVTNDQPEYAKLAVVDSSLAIVNDAVFTMTGLLDFLGTNGDTKIVSNPKVLALNNQQALITIGDTINYKLTTTTNSTDAGATVAQDEEVKSIFVGVLLNITPEITDNGEIILRINPSISSFKYAEDETKQLTARTIAPDTSEKKLSTVVKVQNGNTIILGGLITNNVSQDNSKVPVLGDIPLFGNAFKHSSEQTSTQELIFVITPRIVGTNDNTKATLKDLGFSKRIYEQ